MIGWFTNAQDDGAMGVFTSRAAAEEFVRGDPFVLGGVVRKWTILDWNEVLVPDAPGTLPGAGGWAVAAQDFGVVPVPRHGGAVGVADQGPAHLVDHDVMMEEAQKDAVVQAGDPAAGLVLEVVDLAGRGGLVAAAGPLAVVVPGPDRIADRGRDVLAIADVQRQARPGQPRPELFPAQERGEADGAGGAVAVAGELDAEPDEVVQDGGVDLAGDDRGPGRIAGERVRVLAVQPRGAVAAGHRGGGAVRGPPGPGPLGPPLLELGIGVQVDQVSQGDMRPDFRGLTGPLGQQPGGDQAAHRFLQGVVVPLLMTASIVSAEGSGQRIQDRGQHRGAFRAQVTGQHPGALERGLQPDRP